MNLQQLSDYILGGGGIIILLMTAIQISPIRINPWSYLANKLGKAFNKELIEKVDNISKEVDKLKNKSDERAANNRRSQILHFGDEIRHGIPHSKEHYDNILIDINEYQNYCSEHPEYMNNVAVETIKYIKKVYQNHLVKNDFL